MVAQMMLKREPMVLHDGFWYFWDRTYENVKGPFKSKLEADIAVKQYTGLLDLGAPRAHIDRLLGSKAG